MDTRSDRTVAGHTAVLARHAAASRGIPVRLARQAERATTDRFAGVCREPLNEGARHRMAAYFDAVVRRGAFRIADPDVMVYRRRLVAMSIEEDMRAASKVLSAASSGEASTCPLPLGV